MHIHRCSGLALLEMKTGKNRQTKTTSSHSFQEASAPLLGGLYTAAGSWISTSRVISHKACVVSVRDLVNIPAAQPEQHKSHLTAQNINADFVPIWDSAQILDSLSAAEKVSFARRALYHLVFGRGQTGKEHADTGYYHHAGKRANVQQFTSAWPLENERFLVLTLSRTDSSKPSSLPQDGQWWEASLGPNSPTDYVNVWAEGKGHSLSKEDWIEHIPKCILLKSLDGGNLRQNNKSFWSVQLKGNPLQGAKVPLVPACSVHTVLWNHLLCHVLSRRRGKPMWDDDGMVG